MVRKPYPADLPILTETVDGTPIKVPTLTEAVSPPKAASPEVCRLSDQQCQQLAEQLFPHLALALRTAFGSRSEARWEKAMLQVRNNLPELIRTAAHKPE